jgi:tetraacyldisaccharide 4'-kinase
MIWSPETRFWDWLAWPLCALFAGLSALRRFAYRQGILASVRLPVAVVVVGNLTVGGAGKTPLAVFLAKALKEAGFCPGIVSRGYGGSIRAPSPVFPGSPPKEAGDEPVLLARSGVPVWVGKDRSAAGRALLAAHPEVDVLLCDDGLQHYRLARDVEIAVFDARGAGNGHLLPVGPLREPLSRARRVDFLAMNTGGAAPDPRVLEAAPLVPVFAMGLAPGLFRRLGSGQAASAEAFAGRPLHAYAGIGNPQRFFGTLKGLGLSFAEHPMPDHHAYVPEDFAGLPDDAVVLMTEKDAVKCAGLEGLPEAWALPVEAHLPPGFFAALKEKLQRLKYSPAT